MNGCHGTHRGRTDARRNALAATIRFADVRALPAIIGRIRALFDLGSDVAAINAQLAEDPRLARAGRRATGAARAGRLGSLRARGARRARPTDHGDGRATAGGRSWSPRTASRSRPARTADSPASSRDPSGSRRPTSRSGCRAPASPRCAAIAAAAVADPQLFACDGDLDAKLARLRALPGIGEWTAHYIAMRALREPDAFPAADIGLLRAMTGRDRVRPTPAALLARAERWRPWRAYAAQHLWSHGGEIADSEPSTPGDRRMMPALEHFQIDRIASPLGTLLVVCDDAGRLRALDFHDYEPRMQRLLHMHYGERGFELTTGRAPAVVADALAAFFAGALHAIESIEVRTGGTAFQRRVWGALRQIPAGVTHSYGELARAIGKPSAARAVGLANGANPVVIVVPCHRVIGADGSLTGFGGGIERKRWLLEHEQKLRSASSPIAQREVA